jgi:hypothetical protein
VATSGRGGLQLVERNPRQIARRTLRRAERKYSPWAPFAGFLLANLVGGACVLSLANETTTIDQKLARVFVLIPITLAGVWVFMIGRNTRIPRWVELLRRRVEREEDLPSPGGGLHDRWLDG